jgi:hypothetical protein
VDILRSSDGSFLMPDFLFLQYFCRSYSIEYTLLVRSLWVEALDGKESLYAQVSLKFVQKVTLIN